MATRQEVRLLPSSAGNVVIHPSFRSNNRRKDNYQSSSNVVTRHKGSRIHVRPATGFPSVPPRQKNVLSRTVFVKGDQRNNQEETGYYPGSLQNEVS